MNSTRIRRLRPIATLAVVVTALIGVAPVAQGTIISRDQFGGAYEFQNWGCGYPMSVVGEDSHRVQVRDGRGVELWTDNYRVSEVWTAADGRSFTYTAQGISKDVTARRVGDDTYAFTSIQTGQPFVITDSAGRVVLRDRGALTFEYTIDFATGEFEFLGVRTAGPHPGFNLDFCKAVAPLVGTDSATRHTARPLGSTDAGMGYYEYLPPSYSEAGDKSPLLVTTNGYGEAGDGSPEGLDALLFTGIPRFIDVGGWPSDRPLVVLSTQNVPDSDFDFSSCDFEGATWVGSCAMELQHAQDHSPAYCTTPDDIHAFIDYAVAHYNVDPERVYLTGLSCGAFGSWEYVAKYGNEQIAAAVPIAGEGRPAWDTAGCDLGAVALWAIHGDQDDVVDPDGSIVPMTNVGGCPGVTSERAQLTVYPDLMHDGWDQAYSGSLGDDIYTWMLGFTRT